MAAVVALAIGLWPLLALAQAPAAPPGDVQPPPSSQPVAAEPTGPPATATPPAAQPSPVIGTGHLPRDLSPWSMFLAADWIVKAVMLSLAFASLVTWTVWLAKSLELMFARRRLRRDLEGIGSEASLARAQAVLASGRGVLPVMVDAAAQELQLSSGVAEKGGIKERIASRLARIEVAAGRQMNRGTGLLATIGSTAPFVGLFGTVWGIMNSFIGISKAQTTNLAVVAPGIAEALLATAIGLVAAIPAVIIYNQFARSIAGYRALVGDASAQVQRLASRDLDRGGQAFAVARAAE